MSLASTGPAGLDVGALMQADAKELRAILQDLERHLVWQASDGSKVLLAKAGESQDLPAEPVGAKQPPAERAPQSLEQIRQELGDCRRCKLCSGRTQIVFGVGNPHAELVFVGGGPGAEEDG